MNAHAKRRPPFLHIVPSPLTLALARTAIARPVGKVAKLLLRQSWALRLKLSGFVDLEDSDNPDGPMREHYPHQRGGFRHPPWSREEYYRRLGFAAWKYRTRVDGRIPDPAKDKKIAHALASGWSIRRIKSTFRVMQHRIERVRKALHELMEKETDDG